VQQTTFEHHPHHDWDASNVVHRFHHVLAERLEVADLIGRLLQETM
jgi:hypothetical protein